MLEREIWGNPGLELHDPDRPVFSTDMKATLGWESYLEAMVAALSRLPVELATDLVSRIGDARSVQSPSWESFPCDEHLVIFLLFPATPDQIRETISFIQEAVRKETVSIRSRRDLMTFWSSC